LKTQALTSRMQA